MCEALEERLATAVAAREEAERLHLNASALLNAAEERLLAAEARAAEAEADVARLERLHAACDATIRELTSKALAAVRGQEAAEARAERLAGKAKEMDLLLRFAHGFIGSIVECKDPRFVQSLPELAEWTAKTHAASTRAAEEREAHIDEIASREVFRG